MQSAYKIHNSEKVQSPSSNYNLDFFYILQYDPLKNAIQLGNSCWNPIAELDLILASKLKS